jgi:sugar (pentulose or hexulose) kinase
MTRSVALAVDLGASGGRVVAGSFDGRLLELDTGTGAILFSGNDGIVSANERPWKADPAPRSAERAVKSEDETAGEQ